MSNTSNASKNVRRFLLLFALGIAYGFMYVMPYMKSSFYDQMIAAMGCTNAQLGSPDDGLLHLLHGLLSAGRLDRRQIQPQARPADLHLRAGSAELPVHVHL